MDKFSSVDTTLDYNVSNNAVEEQSYMEPESVLMDLERGGDGGNAYCVIA
jgi:hypothetical protein